MGRVKERVDGAAGWPTHSTVRRRDERDEVPGEGWTNGFRIAAWATLFDVLVAAGGSLAGMVKQPARAHHSRPPA